MPFASATEADWTEARRIAFATCRADGRSAADADDMAQVCILRALKAAQEKTFDRPQQAVRATLRFHQQRGILWRLLPTAKTRRKAGEPIPVDHRGSSSLDPAFMAARAEAMQERTGNGFAPVALARVQEAAGVGPLAMQEAGSTPYIHGSGEAYTPPQTGARGFHTDTDPRPTWHRHTPQPLTGEALAAYRAALADHYAAR